MSGQEQPGELGEMVQLRCWICLLILQLPQVKSWTSHPVPSQHRVGAGAAACETFRTLHHCQNYFVWVSP